MVVFVEDDIEIEITVEVERPVAVDVLSPAADAIPKEHIQRPLLAIGRG